MLSNRNAVSTGNSKDIQVMDTNNIGVLANFFSVYSCHISSVFIQFPIFSVFIIIFSHFFGVSILSVSYIFPVVMLHRMVQRWLYTLTFRWLYILTCFRGYMFSHFGGYILSRFFGGYILSLTFLRWLYTFYYYSHIFLVSRCVE